MGKKGSCSKTALSSRLLSTDVYNVSPSFEAVAIGLAMFIGNATSGYFYSYSSVLAVFQCTIYIQYIFMHNNNTFVQRLPLLHFTVLHVSHCFDEVVQIEKKNTMETGEITEPPSMTKSEVSNNSLVLFSHALTFFFFLLSYVALLNRNHCRVPS